MGDDIGPPDVLLATPTGPLVVPARTAADGVRLSLIIPTYNEADNLPILLAQLRACLEAELGNAYELIVVDDDSPDQTWAVASELALTFPNLHVMRRLGEKGLSTAVIRGWQSARGELLGVMDADLQHPAEINAGLLRAIAEGASLAVASRHIEGGGVSEWSIFRRIVSRGAQLLGLLILPEVLGQVSDPMSGYFMMKRSAVAGVELVPVGYKILIEVIARANIKSIDEVGYVFRERAEGDSKVTWWLYLEYLRHLMRLRLTTLPRSTFFKYCVVGASGVLVDMSILYFLSDPSTLALGLTRSKLIASEAAILTNFFLHDRWTFRATSAVQPGFNAMSRRFLGFNAICAAGVAINVVILNLLFNLAHMNRYLANAIAIVIVTGWNYWLNRKLNWTRTRVLTDSAR